MSMTICNERFDLSLIRLAFSLADGPSPFLMTLVLQNNHLTRSPLGQYYSDKNPVNYKSKSVQVVRTKTTASQPVVTIIIRRSIVFRLYHGSSQH